MGRLAWSVLFLCLILHIPQARSQFGPQQVISTTTIAPGARPFDIDGDGDSDVLAISGEDDKMVWYSNLDGAGNFGPQIEIQTLPIWYLALDFVDIDSDNDKDLIYLVNNPNRISWLENIDGQGTFASEQDLVNNLSVNISSLVVEDIDNDNDLDLIVKISDPFVDRISWFENINGQATLSSENILVSDLIFASDPIIKDIDNDGLFDILVSHEPWGPAKMVWFKNLGNVTFGPEQNIYEFPFDTSDWTSIYDMRYVEINGDGQPDIFIETNHDDLGQFHYWLENIDNQGIFGEPQLVDGIIGRYNFYDLDDDGFNDLLQSFRLADLISWRKNLSGTGEFSDPILITNEVDHPGTATAADINLDGFLDVISASADDNKIAWYQNSGIFDVEDQSRQGLKLYPNPTQGKIKIESELRVAKIKVMNSLMQNVQILLETNTIDLSFLPSGLYYLQITDADQITQVHKVIKN